MPYLGCLVVRIHIPFFFFNSLIVMFSPSFFWCASLEVRCEAGSLHSIDFAVGGLGNWMGTHVRRSKKRRLAALHRMLVFFFSLPLLISDDATHYIKKKKGQTDTHTYVYKVE